MFSVQAPQARVQDRFVVQESWQEVQEHGNGEGDPRIAEAVGQPTIIPNAGSETTN